MIYHDKPSIDELIHFGVLGMKWHQHKQRETQLREKLTKLNNNKSLNGTSDAKRFKYRNQSAAMRIGKTAAKAVVGTLLMDFVSGKASINTYTNPIELRKRFMSVAVGTAREVALQDALANSAAKKYTKDGKRINGTKARFIEKEDAIETGINIAMKTIPVVKIALGLKMAKIRINKKKNEEIFNRWGTNILPQKVDNVVWQSSDLKTAVIDNRKG